MSDAAQANMFDASPDDGLIIIGTPREQTGQQSHSTFRKIDGAMKQGKFVSLSWGDLMVMLPRDLYEAVFAYAASTERESRAAAISELLTQGLALCSE